MMEISSLAAGALQSAMTAGPAASKPEASADAVARFAQSMEPPAAETVPQPLNGEPATAQAVPEIGPATDSSAGDSILRSIDRMSKGFDSTVDQISKAVSAVKPGEPMNAAELLKLQFQLTQVTVQQDVTGKVVGKATQSLDTFLKNQ